MKLSQWVGVKRHTPPEETRNRDSFRRDRGLQERAKYTIVS